MCFVNIYIQYSLTNTDFGVPQKSSKHFLISIFFPPGEGDTLPPPALATSSLELWIPLFYNFAVKSVLPVFICNIALQNTDFGASEVI